MRALLERKPWIANLALLAGSSALAFGGAELVLRMLATDYDVHPRGLYSADPVVGYVPTPGIGIVAASDAAATRAGAEGVVILRTLPGSSAARAGLRGVDPATGRFGDVIVAVDGKPVRRLPDLVQEIERIGVGKRVTLTINRDGRDMSIDLEVVDIGRRG